MAAGKYVRATLAVLALWVSQAAWAADSLYNLREGVTEVSRDIYDLHMYAVWVCVGIGIVVFGAMFYSIFAHRKAKHPEPAKFHHSTVVEIIWTTIPFLILIALAVPATKTLIEIEDNDNAELNILVTGYQWKWSYKYLDGPVAGIEFFSNLATPREQIEGKAPKGENYLLEVDQPLVIPAGKKVRFLVTAKDVIHSWFVPDFGVKQDAVPGFINEAWAKPEKVGVYRGQCTELCGKDHGFMPVVVDVKSDADFAAWAEAKKAEVAAAEKAAAEAAARSWSMDDLMAKGKEIYAGKCAACHGPEGKGNGPFPALDGSKVATGPVADHLHIVIAGKNAMPAWGAQLTDAELAAVITYERNAWSNKTGDVVQPADVAAAKNQ
jgi:cytochrome c oxidase subunit 2